MIYKQQVICLLWLAAVLSVATEAQMHYRARRMLLGGDSADAIDAFEQYAGCAGPPYCPMDSSYWFCYKGSVRCVSCSPTRKALLSYIKEPNRLFDNWVLQSDRCATCRNGHCPQHDQLCQGKKAACVPFNIIASQSK